MRIIILLTLFTFSFLIVSAQSIEDSGVDPFTGKTIVHTSWTGLGVKNILPTKDTPNLDFKLTYEDDKEFLCLRWNNGINSVAKGSLLQLMMDDDSVITLSAVADFVSQSTVSTIVDNTSSSRYIYIVYTGDLSALKNKSVTKMRISTVFGARVVELNEKNSSKISKAYNLIMNEL